jgi:hypothetical protein
LFSVQKTAKSVPKTRKRLVNWNILRTFAEKLMYDETNYTPSPWHDVPAARVSQTD